MNDKTTLLPLSVTFSFSVFVPLDLFRNRHTKGLCSVLLHHIHFQLQVPSCCRVIFSLRWISIASILRHLSQMLLLLLLRHLLYYLRLHLNVNHFTDALIIQRNKIQFFHCRWKETIQMVWTEAGLLKNASVLVISEWLCGSEEVSVQK